MTFSKDTKRYKYVIIGAGPTGLGAAYRLKELGERDFIILERSDFIGGLATSFTDERGFVWDIGGHVQFSHYDYFDQLMTKALGKDGWFHHERESWVWIRDRFVPYPFQNNIRLLPQDEMWQCLQGLIQIYKNPPHQNPKNFKEWIHATFGQGLARVFMEPYNFKVWAYPPEQMSYEWIGERVAVTDLERVTKNILQGIDDVSWGPNSTFHFPKKGGTGAIWTAVARLVGPENIRLNSNVKNISATTKTVALQNGEQICFEQLLNTMPIDRFVNLVDEIPQAVREEGKRLKYSSSNIVGIGLQGKIPDHLQKKCWMYFPEDNSPFYRVTVFSHYSKYNVPDPSNQWSLMAEVSESTEKPLNQENLIDDVIRGMVNTKLIDKHSEIVSRWSYRADYGYPTPSLQRNAALDVLHKAITGLGMYSRGRFGGWKYEVSNQDHACMQGVEWANKLALGIPETTYFYPNTANANWGKAR